MKDGLAHIVGKRIAGVVVAQSPRGPRQQVFLVFEDGTRLEFWGETFVLLGIGRGGGNPAVREIGRWRNRGRARGHALRHLPLPTVPSLAGAPDLCSGARHAHDQQGEAALID